MNRNRALSINLYALLMVGVALCTLLGYGYFTWAELERVRDDVERSSRQAAAEELSVALEHIGEQARRLGGQFAQWEEVRQQLGTPHYYSYWRNHRMLHSELLPDQVLDAEIYDAEGKSLAQRAESRLPDHLGQPLPPPYVVPGDQDPQLLIFETVRDPADPQQLRGFVALRMNFLDKLRENHIYRYLDPGSIRLEFENNRSVAWSALPEHARFTLRPNPMGEAMERVLSGAVLNLGLILGTITLILFYALVYLIVRPLRAISTHIDRLRDSPGGLMLERLGGALPIAETEKIRDSLNSYQSRLLDVHSSLEEKSRELWKLAHHDALTGVQNRRAFDEFWEKIPRMASQHGRSLCFALFDVNYFKAINDSYGHQVGDRVLEGIAGRINTVLRRGEQLFRIGGDEFAAVLLDCGCDDATRIAERCQEAIKDYDFKAIGVCEPVKISIGLAIAEGNDEAALQSLHWQADVAMYKAKRPGHSHVVMFTPEMARDAEGLYSTWINNAVYEAVTQGSGLTMFYQPIMDLTNSGIVYYEALLRIRHEGEWIMPCNIFPVVEARRLEVDLDRMVFRRVVQDLRNGLIPPGTGVSINLSGPSVVWAQLDESLSEFRPYLEQYRIVLEVTETTLITQIGMATENLGRLRRQGFSIALDDFGSGYSSIRYLASMPVDTVKFDIALIRCLEDPDQRNIVLHLAHMILESGNKLVAEGIESAELLEQVRELGFNYGQGYHIGHPEHLGAELHTQMAPAGRQKREEAD